MPAALVIVAVGATVVSLWAIGRSSSSGTIGAAPAGAHCTRPNSDTVFLACAVRECHSAIRIALGNASGATLGAATRVVTADIRHVRLVGAIEHGTGFADRPPRGYECEMSGLGVVSARVIR